MFPIPERVIQIEALAGLLAGEPASARWVDEHLAAMGLKSHNLMLIVKAGKREWRLQASMAGGEEKAQDEISKVLLLRMATEASACPGCSVQIQRDKPTGSAYRCEKCLFYWTE